MVDLELDVNNQLVMDRQYPLGNSPKAPGGRRRLHVFVDQAMSEPIPVYISDSQGGTGQHFTFKGATTPGTVQTLFDMNVPANIERQIFALVVTCRREAYFEIGVDSALVGSGRTGPSCINASFKFSPAKVVPQNKNIKVMLSAASYAPISEVEAYLMCLDTTI